MSSGSVETLIMLSIIVGFAFIIFGILYLVRSLIITSINSWIDEQVVPELLQRTILQSSGIQKIAIGHHLRQLNSIKNFTSNHAINFFFDVPWSIVFLIVLFIIHPYQGLLCLGGIIVIMGMAITYEALTAKNIEKSEEKFNDNVKIADEASRNAEVVMALGMDKRTISSWKEQYKQYLMANNDVSLKSNSILSLLKTVRYLLQMSVTGLGIYLVLQQELSMGGVIACSTLIGRALSPFESSTTSWKSFVEARKAYFKLKDVFNKESNDEENMVELPKPNGELSVENVTYQQMGVQMPLVSDVSFRLEAGESLGVIGRNAAGKSTLIKMLVGVVEPTKGEVRLDGANINYVLKHGFGKYIGYLPQHPQLFDRTVVENIARLHTKDIDSEEVLRVTKLLNIHDMILRMPKGYETPIGSDGLVLSAGQRQAIALARAFYGNPSFIVLDEPNTNLDRDAEQGLLNAIEYAKQQKITLVVITHTHWLLKSVDKAMVMDRGELKLFGPTDKVIEQLSGKKA